MFLFSKPSESIIRTMLSSQRSLDFSYSGVGATQGVMPAGYAVLRGEVALGSGSATFHRAVDALLQWEMFKVPGLRLCWPDTPIRSGEVVAIVARHLGFWSLNFCKIVYVVDEDGPIRRFGFAYGTLAEHAERGEERFAIEWNRASDLVCYNILSFSRPGNAAVKSTLPVARWMQRRFLDHSLAAMADATRID